MGLMSPVGYEKAFKPERQQPGSSAAQHAPNTAAIGKHGQARSAESKCPRSPGTPLPATGRDTI